MAGRNIYQIVIDITKPARPTKRVYHAYGTFITFVFDYYPYIVPNGTKDNYFQPLIGIYTLNL